MKPSKNVSVSHAKRKLSTTSVEGAYVHPTNATRRTRSSSNAGNIYTQRSTRSTQNNAFFELPHSYGSRKQQNDLNEPSPVKRTKRSSTSSSSTNNNSSETENVWSPPSSKRKKQNGSRVELSPSTVSEKENLELFTDQSIEPEDQEKTKNDHFSSPPKCPCAINDAHLNESNDSAPKNLPQSSEQLIVNGHDNQTEKESSNEIIQSSSASKKVQSETEECQMKPINFHSCKNNSKLLIRTSDLGILRKRHSSENETFSTGRIRRLSEKGEMASVMEFFFNHKKPNSSLLSSPVKRFKQVYKKNLRNSTLIQSPGFNLPEDINDICEEQAECDEVERLHESLNGNMSPLCNNTSTIKQNSSKWTCDNKPEHLEMDKNSLSDTESMVSRQRVRSYDANTFNKHENLNGTINPDVYSSHNGVDSERMVDDIMLEISDIKDKQNSKKHNKRSLRSSGVISHPDYYSLGLDLMVHRRRKNRSNFDKTYNTDLRVMSDSEIDFNKKSSIESFVSSNQPPDSTHKVNQLECEDNGIPKNDTVQESSSREPHTVSSPSTSIPSSSCRHGKGRGKNNVQKPVGKQGLTKKELETPAKDLYEVPPLFDEEPPIGPDVYYFESDHVALKHNTDYYAMLRSASILEAQRKQALKDLELLQEKLKYALNDPISFVDSLQKQVDLCLPRDQTVISLPGIDWSKYTSPFGTFENVFSSATLRLPSKPFTRQKKLGFSSGVSSSGQSTSKARSDTFKKSWTVEEQRKLEELLVKYPQEAVEFNRFRKIASELGNRTPLQVQSRVQKYFIKLAKAGLPIPGRMPRLDRMFSCKRTSQRHRTHHQAALTRISTFFSNFHIPVKMTDDDDSGIGSSGGANEDDDGGWGGMDLEQVSDEEDIADELRFSDEYLEILQLKRQRKQHLRMFDKNGRQMLARHYGYQCDLCQSCPIEGVRYHCIDCSESESVDLCQSCIRMQSKFETDLHKSNHRLEPVYANVDLNDTSSTPNNASNSRPFADVDYTKVASSRGEYNYLDPNFLPPSG